MRFRALQPFIAYGKAPEMGEYVDLTEEQAKDLREQDLIAPYEVKVQPVPENKAVKKPSRSVRQGRASRKRTAKK